MKMCWFFIVIRLLIIKILLTGLTGLNAASNYNYGYHPSAEEFDNLLRETRRTWTYNFLKADRERSLFKPLSSLKTLDLQQTPVARTEARYFVPKFQYENEEKKFPLQTSTSSSSSSRKQTQLPLKNIGSTLDFNYFSDELPKPLFNANKVAPLSTTATTTLKPQTIFSPDTSAWPEINLKPIAKPNILTTKNTTTQDHFPIYFTNPATGIVYAITEMGKTEKNLTRTNGSIPIFITKEQYERDIYHLKQELKQKCTRTQTKIAPLATVSPLKKPSPVVVKTEIIVKDKKPPTILRPLRKKKKKSKVKRKLKKHNPPGHNPVRTTLRPASGHQPDGPVIIMGSKGTTTLKPLLNKEKVPTQLEKPNFDNIFSSVSAPYGLKPPKKGLLEDPVLFKQHHKIKKRSTQGMPTSLKHILKTSLKNPLFLAEFQRDNKVQNTESENLTFDFSKAQLRTKIKKDNKEEMFSNYKIQTENAFNLKNRTALHNFKLSGGAQNMSELEDKEQNMENLPTSLKGYDNESVKKFSKHPYNIPSEASENKDLKISNIRANRFKSVNILKGSNNVANATNFNKYASSEIFKGLLENKAFIKLLENNTKNIAKHQNNLKGFRTNRNLTKIFLKNYNNSDGQNIAKILSKIFQNPLKEHRMNKRSVNNLEPKFIKKINFTANPIDLRNSTEYQMKNSERSIKANKQTSNKTSEHKVLLKKLNEKSKIKSSANNTTTSTSKASPKLIKKKAKKRKSHKNMEKKSKRQQEDDYYFFTDYEGEGEEEEEDDDYEDDDDEDDDDDVDDEEEEELENNPNEMLAYDDNDDMPSIPTSEVNVSLEDFTDKPVTQETKSSLEEEDNDISSLQIEHIKFKAPAAPLVDKLKLKAKPASSLYFKKRIRRRPQFKIDRHDYDDYDDEEDNSLSSNLGGFFRMIFYPIQVVMGSVMDSLAGKDADEEEAVDDITLNPYTQYTSYHNTLKHQSTDDYDEDYDSNESSSTSLLSSWFSSWFGLNRRNKKIGSTTVAPVQPKPTKSSSWLPSWLSFGNNDRISTESTSTEDYDEYDKWFASWFGETKPKARKTTTTTTSTTTQIPHVPILTIVDPMRNPQNWIGILAHHIINHTSTSTANPLKDMWSKVTSVTTENPEIPRKISYDKYQIWRLKPQDDAQVKALEEYKKSEDGIKLQWLKGPSLRGLTDVLVPPRMLVDFQASLTFELIDHEVLIFDVGKAIAYEKTKEDYFFTTTQKPKKHQNKLPVPSLGFTWRRYYEYDDIIKYLETMRMRFPHLVELIHIGRSYEGRPLIVMKIESKEAAEVNSANYPAHQRNKLRHKKRIGLANAVFIEAGTHGMEWIGPATATWIINELLRIMKKNVSDDQSFIRNTTWYIIPILNPDGYVYSHEYDRFWKKSRSRHISRPSGLLNSAMTWLQKKRAKEKVCFGVDLDRNWHYQWGRRGSSKTPCNEFYAGPTPFSDPETKALSEFLMDYRTQIKLFISMQAYGQIISYPYKANTTYDTERLDDLLDVAMVGTDGLRKKGSKSRYKIDSSNDLVENRSGCSDAFAAYEVGIPFSYTLQLADNGVHGYLLPSASIESTAKDAFEIVTGMLDYI